MDFLSSVHFELGGAYRPGFIHLVFDLSPGQCHYPSFELGDKDPGASLSGYRLGRTVFDRAILGTGEGFFIPAWRETDNLESFVSHQSSFGKAIWAF